MLLRTRAIGAREAGIKSVSTSHLGELGGLSTADLKLLFLRGQNDIQLLRQLNEELKTRASDADTDLQINVVMRLRILQRENTGIGLTVATDPQIRRGPVRAWLAEFFQNRGIERPDARPLFRYRLTDLEFDKAGKLLRELHLKGRLENPDLHAGALFVIFGAEWFRRKADNTFRVWDKLAPDILSEIPWTAKKHLTEHGLRYWRRPLRKSDHGREFLLSIALEGGFPVRVLAEGGRSWLRAYLNSVMRRSLSVPEGTDGAILAIAGEEKGLLRESYQDQDFIELCADLVATILRWRRLAEAEAQGIDPVIFLDQKYRNWREEIPIHLPAGDDSVAKDLLNGLVRETAAQLVAANVGCARMLVRDENSAWAPALRIFADGEISRASFKMFAPRDGRIRARPVGKLAEMLSDVMARLEPPGENGETWRVQPLMNLEAPLLNFPFFSDVAVDLFAAGLPPKRFPWPGGDSLRSDLLVFAAEGEESTVTSLKLVGRGSTKARYETLYALVPENWSAQAGQGGENDTITQAIDSEPVPALHAKLFVLREAAWLGDESENAWYYVEPRADPDERRLIIEGRHSSDVTATDPRISVYTGQIAVFILEGGRQRKIKENEVFWGIPSGVLSDIAREPPRPGLIDIVWRDSANSARTDKSIQRDRQRVVVLPPAAEVKGRMIKSDRAEISVSGLKGWSFDAPAEVNREIQKAGERFEITFTGQPFYSQQLNLVPPNSPGFNVTVPLPGRDAALVHSDGRLARPGAILGLADLRGMTLVAPSPVILGLSLKSYDAPRSAHIRIPVETEQPLGALRSTVDELLAITNDLDALVELEIAGQSGLPQRVKRFRWPDLIVTKGGELRAADQPIGSQAVVRMLDEPRHEYALQYIPATQGHSWVLPETVNGPCLVYLRAGSDVVSRPTIAIATKPPPPCDVSSLRGAARLSNAVERKKEIAEALKRMTSDISEGAQSERAWLTAIICGLNGLPATTLDTLKELARAPMALAHLLVSAASAEERSAIFSLERELPFLWLALPIRAWARAFFLRLETVSAALVAALPEGDHSKLALDDLIRCGDAILALEPALDTAFAMGSVPRNRATLADNPLTLEEVAGAHIRRSLDRDAALTENAMQSAARLTGHGLAIPGELQRFDLLSHGDLLSPCLLAASAAGRLRLKQEDLLVLRRALREDPDYISQAYALILPQYAKNLT